MIRTRHRQQAEEEEEPAPGYPKIHLYILESSSPTPSAVVEQQQQQQQQRVVHGEERRRNMMSSVAASLAIKVPRDPEALLCSRYVYIRSIYKLSQFVYLQMLIMLFFLCSPYLWV